MKMNGMHFGETSNLKEIPDNLFVFVHRQTRNISIHVSIDGCLEVAFPEVKSCFELVQGRWSFSQIFFDIFIKVPVAVLVKHIKQERVLFIDVTPPSFIVQCSLEQQQQKQQSETVDNFFTGFRC